MRREHLRVGDLIDAYQQPRGSTASALVEGGGPWARPLDSFIERFTRKPESDFVERFIVRLRTPGAVHPLYTTNAGRLARHLEWRLTPRGDGFDLVRTGDDAKDREALAAWLEARERDPPF